MKMLRSPKFEDVKKNCKSPLPVESSCWRCLNSGIAYLHHLVGAEELSLPLLTPEAFPSPLPAASPSQLLVGTPFREHHRSYLLMVISGVGIAVTVVAVLLLIVLILLIRRKSRELQDLESPDKTSSKALSPQPIRNSQEGLSMFQKFSNKETMKATDNFSTIIGRGGFGAVYKAQFADGFVAAVKRMNKISEQGEDEFCQDMELLGRLHHRHLVFLKDF